MGRLITHSTPRLLRLSSLLPLFFVLIFKCMELHNLRIVEASESHILGTGALHHSRVSRGIWVVPWKAPLSPRQGFLVLREIALNSNLPRISERPRGLMHNSSPRFLFV